jgi:hypothetical protein
MRRIRCVVEREPAVEQRVDLCAINAVPGVPPLKRDLPAPHEQPERGERRDRERSQPAGRSVNHPSRSVPAPRLRSANLPTAPYHLDVEQTQGVAWKVEGDT